MITITKSLTEVLHARADQLIKIATELEELAASDPSVTYISPHEGLGVVHFDIESDDATSSFSLTPEDSGVTLGVMSGFSGQMMDVGNHKTVAEALAAAKAIATDPDWYKNNDPDWVEE